jgi:hypothetical protein
MLRESSKSMGNRVGAIIAGKMDTAGKTRTEEGGWAGPGQGLPVSIRWAKFAWI